MSEYVIDIPDEIMNKAKLLAQQKQVSLNHFLVSLITENLTQSVNNALIQQRAKNAKIETYLEVLQKIPIGETKEGDEKSEV